MLLLVLGWFVIWLTVCWLIGSTWCWLAQQYLPVDDFQGEESRFRNGKLNWIGYGNCLTLIAGYRYLPLAVFFPFRFGHPRVSIPWSEVRLRAQTGRWHSWVALSLQ